MRHTKLVAAAMLAVCLAPAASAQTGAELTAPYAWTSADGGLRFNVPAGWVRHDIPKGKGPVLAVSKGDTARDEAGVHCKLTVGVVMAAPPGTTQATMNANLQAGASKMTSVEEIRVFKKGGVAAIDGYLAMTPRILAVMKAYYFHGGNIYQADWECGRAHPPTTLRAEDLAIARQLFDTISITP